MNASVGLSFGINFNTSYFSKYDIESIVYYNRKSTVDLNLPREVGFTIELLNTNDNVRVSSTEISSLKLYYRFDGPRIGDATLSTSASTTAIIDDSANTESLTEVTDLGTLDYLFSKVRVIRTSSNGVVDNLICKELQVFINNENKGSNTKSGLSYINTAGTSGGLSISRINDGAFSLPFSSSGDSIGLYFGINFNESYYSKYDVESIVHYANVDAINGGGDGTSNGLSIELLNDNDNVRIASSQMSSSKLYYRMDGIRIDDGATSSSPSPNAIIDDSGNTGSLTGL